MNTGNSSIAKNRKEMFDHFLRMDVTYPTIGELTDPMRDMSVLQKEERAGQIAAILSTCDTEAELKKKLSDADLL